MNMLMHQTMRWFGPDDPVSLADIRQAGCEGVVSALQQAAVGGEWKTEAIDQRKQLIEEAGMTWTVVESLPVSEDIKMRNGQYLLHIENYKKSLKNLAAGGLKVVTYNFMPVLDWVRTDISYPMPDGSKALHFEQLAFAAIDLFVLKRPGAKDDYSLEQINKAEAKYSAMTTGEKERLLKNTMLGLPGSDDSFTPAQVLASLEKYRCIDAGKLCQNLIYFLQQVVPAAEDCGLKLAIHPDDPPYGILGLPRIVSTEQNIADIIAAVPSPANGLCFCTGSLGARADNDILKMLRRFGGQVHFLHLRNTTRDAGGNFYEADHLAGDTDLYEVVKEVLLIQRCRKISIPMRPDHGHQMMDDLGKKTYPGYSAIGRLKGLAEIRGLEYGLSKILL